MKCIWKQNFYFIFNTPEHISSESYLLTSIQRVKGITNGLRRYFAEVVTSKIIVITPTLRAPAWAAALFCCKSLAACPPCTGYPHSSLLSPTRPCLQPLQGGESPLSLQTLVQVLYSGASLYNYPMVAICQPSC